MRLNVGNTKQEVEKHVCLSVGVRPGVALKNLLQPGRRFALRAAKVLSHLLHC